MKVTTMMLTSKSRNFLVARVNRHHYHSPPQFPSLSHCHPCLSKKQKLANDSPKYKTMTKGIEKMITVDLRPLSVTGKAGFGDFSSLSEDKETQITN